MDMTVRARALAIEMEAREHAPAAAINALAIRCAQLEARCAEWERRAEEASAVPRFTYDGSFEPINTLMVDGAAGRCDPIAGFHATPHVGCILR